MKPGAAWREEPWWHWDWPGRPEQRMGSLGGVQHLGGSDDKSEVAAKLYVPEGESPTGWRDYYVYRDKPKPGSRRLGL